MLHILTNQDFGVSLKMKFNGSISRGGDIMSRARDSKNEKKNMKKSGDFKHKKPLKPGKHPTKFGLPNPADRPAGSIRE